MKQFKFTSASADKGTKTLASIGIIDHGFANIRSLCNALQYVGFETIIISTRADFDYHKIQGFVLPGVGSFQPAMRSLRDKNLDHVIYDLVERGIKGMGICLGMQMLAKASGEDSYVETGLEIFPGFVERINSKTLPVPNISWMETYTTTDLDCNCSSLHHDLNGTFYYVHSYAYKAEKQDSSVVAKYLYGDQEITAAFYKENILGLQFHPEKSQSSGLTLLKNYFS